MIYIYVIYVIYRTNTYIYMHEYSYISYIYIYIHILMINRYAACWVRTFRIIQKDLGEEAMPRKNEVKCRHGDSANGKCTQEALTPNTAQPLFFFQLTRLGPFQPFQFGLWKLFKF